MLTPEISKSSMLEERERWDRVAAIVLNGTRRDLDMSQRELALRLGWSRNMVANLESGRRTLHLSDFLMIARALDINPEILLQRIVRWGQSNADESQRFPA